MVAFIFARFLIIAASVVGGLLGFFGRGAVTKTSTSVNILLIVIGVIVGLAILKKLLD